MHYEILIPAVYLMFLTFVVTGVLGYRRFKAVQSRQVSAKYYLLYQQGEETETLRKIARHYANLFEMPVSFYFLTVLIFITEQSSALLLTLCWLYVALRTVHTFIHLGPNRLHLRFGTFLLGYLILVVAWIAWVLGVWFL